jgi:hypothetical protein
MGALLPLCIVKVCIVCCERLHHCTLQYMSNKIQGGNLLSSFTWHHCCWLAFSEYNFELQAQYSWLFLSAVLLYLEQMNVKMRDNYVERIWRLLFVWSWVQVGTVEFAVDLGSFSRWGKSTVLCLWPIADILQLDRINLVVFKIFDMMADFDRSMCLLNKNTVVLCWAI